MLDEIILGLKKYVETDAAIRELVGAAERAKKMPDLTKCYMAVLEQQNAGKSTLLNALLGCILLEKSGDRKSCTAVPTILTYKEGADDDTRESDVKVEWLSEDQHPDHIWEHIKRWGDVHPGNDDDEQEAGEDVEDDASDAEEIESEPEDSKPKKKKNSKDPGVSTAKDFFELIFNAENDRAAKKDLHNRLYNTNIRKTDFNDICLQKLSARFQQLSSELKIKNDVSEFPGVHDKDLGRKRRLLLKLWPFVKAFTISTGHILLRYGMCFYDLPGMTFTF